MISHVTDEIFHLKPWIPKLRLIANELINSINQEAPELTVLFMGAAALEIDGKNDIDLDILCDQKDLAQYTDRLAPVLGKPTKHDSIMSMWELSYNGVQIDAILSDPTAPGSHVPTQLKQFEKLKASPHLREQYRLIKLACDGLPYMKYEKQKKAFL